MGVKICSGVSINLDDSLPQLFSNTKANTGKGLRLLSGFHHARTWRPWRTTAVLFQEPHCTRKPCP